MKYAIVLGDGMADHALAELGGKTPLEYAGTPNMDRVAGEGTLGLIDTIPRGLQPGSDVANLAVLGYDPSLCYTGRGPLEAANMGIALSPTDVAFRCNLVTLGHDPEALMEDFTAGHISSSEAKQIIGDLDREIGTEEFRFYPGVGYRHLMVWKGGSGELTATPPHDITGKASGPYLPKGPGAERIVRLMRLAQEFLAGHPTNRERTGKALKPANSIWLWGQGRAPQVKRITDQYQLWGGVISAVDLLNGIGVYAGLEILSVEGATGYTDTNYLGKGQKAVEALKELDFVFVHVEAPDEMGHEGNVEGKIRAIEEFDEKVVGTILRGIADLGPFRVVVLSDHPTPVHIRTHTADPSPFALLSTEKGENQARKSRFGESEARRAGNLITPGYRFMDLLVRNWRSFVVPNNR